MDNLSRNLTAKPDGILYLFLDGGVSVDFLASAFETEPNIVESSLREAMRKRQAIARADAPATVELIRKTHGAS